MIKDAKFTRLILMTRCRMVNFDDTSSNWRCNLATTRTYRQSGDNWRMYDYPRDAELEGLTPALLLV